VSYYVNGDDGYLWLTHEDCEEPLYLIEAGVYLWELNEAVKAHVCKNNGPTPNR
jgi:hypothetical protein